MTFWKKNPTVLGGFFGVILSVLLLSCPFAVESNKDRVTEVIVSTTDVTFIKLDKVISLDVEVKGRGIYDKSVTWKSSDETKATVKEGKVTGKKIGKVTITATSVSDTSISDSIELEVRDGYVDIVTIEGDNLKLTIGLKETLKANVTTVGTVEESEKTVTWSSDNPDVASINKTTGEIEAKGKGTANISAMAGGVRSATILVTVDIASIKFDVTWNGTKYTASKEFIPATSNENTSIVNIFIDEDYDSTKPLNLSVTATLPTGYSISPDMASERNYSDQTADIFEISDGIATGKFRLHIFRRPILVNNKPAANTDTGYDSSGASSVSIRRFVQSDYYNVPALVDDKASNLPAPTFALFDGDATPTTEAILSSTVRVLRNFTTADGNTLFFCAMDDEIAGDEWDDKHQTGNFILKRNSRLNPSADLLGGLMPSTNYTLHYAVDASNGKFSGSLGTVSTTELPATNPNSTTGIDKIKYFGIGGMEVHWVEGADLSLLSFLGTQGKSSHLNVNFESGGQPLVAFGKSAYSDLAINSRDAGSRGGINYSSVFLCIQGTALPSRTREEYRCNYDLGSFTTPLQIELE